MSTGPSPPDASLTDFIDVVVSVVSNDGRVIVGYLRGFDQNTNLILTECHERVFSSETGVEQVALGTYLFRGDNVAIIGEVDEEMDSRCDLTQLRAPPLKPLFT